MNKAFISHIRGIGDAAKDILKAKTVFGVAAGSALVIQRLIYALGSVEAESSTPGRAFMDALARANDKAIDWQISIMKTRDRKPW